MVLFVVGTQYLSAASKEVLDLEIKETIIRHLQMSYLPKAN
jgi:hypothetical protein